MRYLIALWAFPLVLFWGWYFLSLNDINFGYVVLSRRLNDVVFELYGEMLGIDPATIPPMIARTCVFELVSGGRTLSPFAAGRRSPPGRGKAAHRYPGGGSAPSI